MTVTRNIWIKVLVQLNQKLSGIHWQFIPCFLIFCMICMQVKLKFCAMMEKSSIVFGPVFFYISAHLLHIEIKILGFWHKCFYKDLILFFCQWKSWWFAIGIHLYSFTILLICCMILPFDENIVFWIHIHPLFFCECVT